MQKRRSFRRTSWLPRRKEIRPPFDFCEDTIVSSSRVSVVIIIFCPAHDICKAGCAEPASVQTAGVKAEVKAEEAAPPGAAPATAAGAKRPAPEDSAAAAEGGDEADAKRARTEEVC